MRRKVLALLLGLALAAPALALAHSRGSRAGSRSRSSAGSHLREHGLSQRRDQSIATGSGEHHKPSARCTTCQRDEHGGIKRSEDAKRDFMNRSGHPRGRKGYVVDHIVPLGCGGADSPSNMQWQTKAEARAKDRWERSGCKR